MATYGIIKKDGSKEKIECIITQIHNHDGINKYRYSGKFREEDILTSLDKIKVESGIIMFYVGRGLIRSINSKDIERIVLLKQANYH